MIRILFKLLKLDFLIRSLIDSLTKKWTENVKEYHAHARQRRERGMNDMDMLSEGIAVGVIL